MPSRMYDLRGCIGKLNGKQGRTGTAVHQAGKKKKIWYLRRREPLNTPPSSPLSRFLVCGGIVTVVVVLRMLNFILYS